MRLTHLTFTGERKTPASIEFGDGLNLVYGPSNTGKSSILDAIDFMLGRDRALKEIPEHDGYELVFLGISFSTNQECTLVRSLSGGDFRCFDGLHSEIPKSIEPKILRPKTATKKIESLPNFLLGELGLANKFLRKNAQNETEKLTVRNFKPLFIVNETEIQRESSPYISTQFTKETSERSRLKLVLTGSDDSSLIPEEKEKAKVSRQARLSLLTELIDEQRDTITDIAQDTSYDDLVDQQSKLTATLTRENTVLQSTESQYQAAILVRTKLRQSIEMSEQRKHEIDEMLQRFSLLQKQYDSDMARLDNLIEAGTLFVAFPGGTCPVCGSDTSGEDSHNDCDGNADEVVDAANSEKQKIAVLRGELSDVIDQLNDESQALLSEIPETQRQLLSSQEEVARMSPIVSEHREQYSRILTKRTSAERTLGLFQDLKRLEEKKQLVEEEAPDDQSDDGVKVALPTKALHDLSTEMSNLLREWGLTDAKHIHYDKETDDFVIEGKHRTSNGKGHRALTHAAATLALLRHTEDKGLPYPGFALLDSPLLAYEKPEFDEEELAQTDINVRFFDVLSKWLSRQVIVFENRKSVPLKYAEGKQITHFTKSEKFGRYGFFPR